jgi:glycosyltransferase involved in cell wall biosynthesis
VVAVSEAERVQIRSLEIPDTRIATITNLVNFDEHNPPVAPGAFRRKLKQGSGPVVTFLGKLTPRKRLDVLARAFARLDRPGAQLVIAGNDMGSGPGLRRLAASLGIGDQTTFAGLLTGRDRLEALADSDVVVYASKDEVFGLVPLEAILCGTPVVVASDSGCGEIIRQVGGGLVVTEGSETELAGAVGTILDGSDEWRRAAVAAQAAVRKFCDADAVCDRLEALYQDVIHN